MQVRRKSRSVYLTDVPMQSVNTKHKTITVPKECNMIEFAKEKIENYEPDSGNGYYQFIEGTEEYIPPKTRVVLVSEVRIVINLYAQWIHLRSLSESPYLGYETNVS